MRGRPSVHLLQACSRCYRSPQPWADHNVLHLPAVFLLHTGTGVVLLTRSPRSLPAQTCRAGLGIVTGVLPLVPLPGTAVRVNRLRPCSGHVGRWVCAGGAAVEEGVVQG